MKASKFSEAHIAFVLKQAEGEVCRYERDKVPLGRGVAGGYDKTGHIELA